jgi:oxygen-independent coproporphyrinogen-3 oxidase
MDGARWRNTADTSRYIEQLQAAAEPIDFKETITGRIRNSEAIAFGLRTSVGVPEEAMKDWSSELTALRNEGYLEETNSHVRLTEKGRMVADSIAELFV